MRTLLLFLLLCAAMFPANAQYSKGDSLKRGPGTVAGASREQSEFLPHAFRHDRVEKRFYPHLFGTIGITSYSPNFDGLQQVLRDREESYLKREIEVGKGILTLTPSPLMWVSFGIDFSSKFRVNLEGGWNFEEKSRIYAGTLGIYYMPSFAGNNFFQCFVGPGIVFFRTTVAAKYDAALGNGRILSGVNMEAQQFGGFLRGGVELELIEDFSVILDGSYYLVQPSTSNSHRGSANFSSFSAGARILFHFSGGPTP